MRRARAVAGGGLLVAAFVIACANGALPTDLTPDGDSGYLDVTRREVEPVPPGDDGSTPPPTPPPPPPPGDGGGSGAVVINEVQTGGGTASDEFVELYNGGSASASLSGLTLYYHAAAGGSGNGTTIHAFASGDSIAAGGYFLLTNTGYSGTAGQATYTNGLAAAGGQIALVDGAMTKIDAVGWGTATGPYVEGTAAAAPPSGQSIARKPNGHDSNANASDFAVATTPTPGAAN